MVKRMMVAYGKQRSQGARRRLVASMEKISRSRGVPLLTRKRYIAWKRMHDGDSKSDAVQSCRRDKANTRVYKATDADGNLCIAVTKATEINTFNGSRHVRM